MYDARCSNIPRLVHWIPETNAGRIDHLVTDDNDNQSGSHH